MNRVTGIGGIFIKAKDPQAMYAWYEKHLGIARDATAGAAMFTWRDKDSGEEGQTVWSLFEQSSKYFDPSNAQMMINYRVSDMDAVVRALEEDGVKVLGRDDAEYGRFAWIMDPEGNKIELWESPKSRP
jgi:predicted enzyme related to lactoylglutathione lyase